MSSTALVRPGYGRRTTAHLTPLGETMKAPVRVGARMRREVIAAFSADGIWTYERDDTTGTPWTVTHTPTGLTQPFTNLDAARRWTASDRALPFLAALAGDKLRAATTPDAVRAARRLQAILAEQVIPFVETLLIDYRCVCGGYLTRVGGRLVHVDTCDIDGCSAGCEEHHEVCIYPLVAICDHAGCTRWVDAHAPQCLADHDDCCGCCNGAE